MELFPTIFDKASNSVLFNAISKEDILRVLKSFKGDKSLGPDGWILELFTHFFYLIK